MANIAGRRPPKIFSHMVVRAGENGGHGIEHHFESYEHPPETYHFGKMEGREMLTHIHKHMGVHIEPPSTTREPKALKPGDMTGSEAE